MDTYNYDVVIVGGGPAGCSCALYTARADLKTAILDKNAAVGALAITHKIANYPGVLGEVGGGELLDEMRQQATTFGADYVRAQVFSLGITGPDKKVYTPDGTYVCKALVLATGAMGRIASYKGEAEFLGRGVSYCATCDGAFYRDRDVAVVGLNPEAIEEAQVLTKFAATVHWITHRRPAEGDTHAKALLATANVQHWNRTRLAQIEGDIGGVTAVQVKQQGKSEAEVLPVDGVFVYQSGSKPITDFIGDQVLLKSDGGVQVDDMMMTSVDGVWAVGDIRNTPFKQAVVAASDGCIAAMSIDRYLNQRKLIKPDWDHR